MKQFCRVWRDQWVVLEGRRPNFWKSCPATPANFLLLLFYHRFVFKKGRIVLVRILIKTPQDCCEQQFLGRCMIWMWIYGKGKHRRNLQYVIYLLLFTVLLPIYTRCMCVGSLLRSGRWHILRSFTAPPIWNPLVKDLCHDIQDEDLHTWKIKVDPWLILLNDQIM